MLIALRHVLILSFLIIFFNTNLAQQQSDYVPDWPNLFFSNINLTSDESNLILTKQSPGIKFSSTFRYNDFYHGKIEPDIERKIIFWSLTHYFEYPCKIFKSDILIGAHFQSYEKKINYESNPQESFSLVTECKTYSLSILTQSRPNHVDINLNLGKKNLGSTSYFPWSVGLGFNLNNFFRIQYKKLINYFDWDYQIEFRQPAINLSVPEKMDLDQVFFSSRIFGRLEFKAILQVNALNDQHGFDKSKTTLLFRGDQYYRWLSVSFKSEPAMEWSLSYRNWQSDTDGYFYDQEQVFGKFTKRDEFSETFSLEFQYSWSNQRSGIHLDWGKGELAARGHVESWPFTPTWVDLMGLRYNLDSELTYRFIRGGGSYTYYAPTWQASLDLCGERILPMGVARTWEPEIIGIGIKNLTIYELSSKKRDGIYLGINLGKKFWQFIHVSYQFNQYIPVDLSKVGKGKGGGVSAGKKEYGGGRHLVEFILYL